VSKVTKENELLPKIKEAAKFDSKVIVERGVRGREIECALIGNAYSSTASVLGEIKMTGSGFYDYDSKYSSKSSVKTVINPPMDAQNQKQLINTAQKSFAALGLEGLARVDMFLTAKGEIFVNEINTLPGFTQISMYPQLFEASGVGYSELLDKLITEALSRPLKVAR
jgi:D-alanine-D-alanine ligase